MGSIISLAEKDIENFMAYCGAEFPGSTEIPKIYILEDHTIPWLQRWHLRAGLTGEQGAECIHAVT